VRWVVAGLAVAAVLAMALLDPAVFLIAEPAFWLILLAGTGGGGLVSSVRLLAPPTDAVVRPRSEASAARVPAGMSLLLTRTLGDAGWAIAIVTAGMVGRAVIAGLIGGWSPESVRSIIITPLMAVMTFAGMWIAGALVVIALTLGRRLLRERRAGRAIPATAWWSAGAVAGLALFVPGLLAVGLSDTSTVSGDGLDAFVTFLVGDVWLDQAWQVVLLWVARLGFAVLAASLAGLLVTRVLGRSRS